MISGVVVRGRWALFLDYGESLEWICRDSKRRVVVSIVI